MNTRNALLSLGLAAAAAGCASALPQAQPPALVERFDPHGISPRQRAVESGGTLTFVNDDTRAHEIYSSDCRELQTTPIAPGQKAVARVEAGPRTCHFQDLLAPSASEFWGTVQVAEPKSVATYGEGG